MDGESRPPKEELAALKEDINKIMFGKYMVRVYAGRVRLAAVFSSVIVPGELLVRVFMAQYTAIGCVLAVPVGIKSRSLWPLAILGSAGTIGDITEGYLETESLRARRYLLEKQIEAASTNKRQ